MAKKKAEEAKETEKQSEETVEQATAEVEQEEKAEKKEDPAQLLQEQKEKYLRLFADFDNFRKRTAKERLDLLDTAGKDVILSILPVLDDFDRAITAADQAKEVGAVKEGMELIRNKLFSVLEQRGLKPMDCVGEPFDPEQQEAITEIPAPNADMKGKVVDQIEKGYTLNNKIIRHAKVVVGK